MPVYEVGSYGRSLDFADQVHCKYSVIRLITLYSGYGVIQLATTAVRVHSVYRGSAVTRPLRQSVGYGQRANISVCVMLSATYWIFC